MLHRISLSIKKTSIEWKKKSKKNIRGYERNKNSLKQNLCLRWAKKNHSTSLSIYLFVYIIRSEIDFDSLKYKWKRKNVYIHSRPTNFHEPSVSIDVACYRCYSHRSLILSLTLNTLTMYFFLLFVSFPFLCHLLLSLVNTADVFIALNRRTIKQSNVRWWWWQTKIFIVFYHAIVTHKTNGIVTHNVTLCVFMMFNVTKIIWQMIQ